MFGQIFKQENIEVIVPAGSTVGKIMFGDQPRLRNNPIFGIQTFSRINQQQSPNQVTLINELLFASTYLTLQNARGEEQVNMVPLAALRIVHGGQSAVPTVTDTNNFVNIKPQYAGLFVDWSKSYIQITDVSNINDTNDEAIMLLVDYMERTDLATLASGNPNALVDIILRTGGTN